MQNNATPWTEIFSIASSISSLIISLFAIGLSIFFYRMSDKSANNTQVASDRINATVDRLEVLFGKLYGDTFSIVKDTVSDMRKRVWSDQPISSEAEKRADEKINQISNRFENELTALLTRQSTTDERLREISSEVKRLFGEAITQSRNAELQAKEETTRRYILRMLSNAPNKRLLLGTIISSLKDISSDEDIIVELFKLHKENVVTWDGEPHILKVGEVIRLISTQPNLFEPTTEPITS